jgi:integrase
MKLSQLNAPAVRRFEETLRAEGHSPTMVKYIVRSLGALLADAQESGLVVRNAVRELSGKRRHKKSQNNARAQRGGKLRVGVDIPTKDEIRAIVNAAEGRWRPLLITAIFTGLRASELRGLRWDDVDFEAGVIHVTQRADRFNKIGPPKTAAGQRSLPMGNLVRNTLTAWQKECPKGKLRLTFPNGKGNVEFHVNIIERGLRPTLIRAGITVPALDEAGEPLHGADGRPLVEAKYTGMHALRHFYASWCASMGLSMKVVQVRMGHSNIAVTMDTYTHLFPDSEDPAKLAEAENALLGMNATQGAA